MGNARGDADLIYGLGLLVIYQTAAEPSLDLDAECVAFYIDNRSDKGDLIKADAKRATGAALARIFWAICADGRVPQWIGGVIRIAIFRTPCEIIATSGVLFGGNLPRVTKLGIEAQSNEYSEPGELIGMFY